ncbi:kanamycin nucleotidyltransferase C-terminal domain-containing protein [Paenibacillus thiaminolyticus]|uniref:Uncharacterized protein n=1 Tax=Paenibacillus thiaminolyticus TaxID=49283 RepID=A0A3A3GLZ3_PANTH|nr:kanamycin nucleotidyltransferase C-terminal domain-containing protein [Paenibacillus thiaminolyticus]RJG23793.1 hypothetical protein DQX05_12295 [Paenibacillus thiaminolyticus]
MKVVTSSYDDNAPAYRISGNLASLSGSKSPLPAGAPFTSRFRNALLHNPDSCPPDRPQDFDELAGLVISGELADQERIVAISKANWQGPRTWASKHRNTIVMPAKPL